MTESNPAAAGRAILEFRAIDYVPDRERQFGIYGAILPILSVLLMYIGFSAGGSVLAG